MFSFTRQERMVVLCLMAIIATGACIDLVFKKYPELENIVNLIEGDRLYTKLDLNKATRQELVAIPYIGEYTAQKILDYRRRHGKFTRLQQLKQVKGIREKNYQKFIRYLMVEE